MQSEAKKYNPSKMELTRRAEIVNFEEVIRNTEGSLGEDPFPLKHHFAPGVYAREILLPEDTVIIGKIHKHDHLIIFLSGVVSISSYKGVELVTTPGVAILPVGIKRAVYAHVDSRIVTIHVTDKTDLEEIEEEVIAKNFGELQLNNKKFEVLP